MHLLFSARSWVSLWEIHVIHVQEQLSETWWTNKSQNNCCFGSSHQYFINLSGFIERRCHKFTYLRIFLPFPSAYFPDTIINWCLAQARLGVMQILLLASAKLCSQANVRSDAVKFWTSEKWFSVVARFPGELENCFTSTHQLCHTIDSVIVTIATWCACKNGNNGKTFELKTCYKSPGASDDEI